jgi:hypothetical protein
MQFIGIDVHSNRFTCCYRDEGPTEKRIETFELDEAGLAAFYRTLMADTCVLVKRPSRVFALCGCSRTR